MSDVKEAVRKHYADAAKEAIKGESACCCSKGDIAPVPLTSYRDDDLKGLPREAVLASLGCGNPTAVAELHEGETVLDLGSGGGIDVLLSARRVGPAGKAYGLDMTDEMLELARENQRRAGVENVEFLKGEIEAVPLTDASVDVIISNCVINLSADKDRVFREAFRVLRPGGRFAVSDVVARQAVPDGARENLRLWAECVSGSLSEAEYTEKLEAAGFVDVGIEPLDVFDVPNTGQFASAIVRARKPSP
jgi:arsenite methyltransferase